MYGGSKFSTLRQTLIVDVEIDQVEVEGWGESPRDVGGGVSRREASDSSDSDESCSRSSRCGGPFRCVCEVLVILAHFRHLNRHSNFKSKKNTI